MRINALPTAERSLAAALALGPLLVARARSDSEPWIAASVVSGPAIVLGALQRAGRVVDFGTCAHKSVSVMRRATTGTSVHLGGKAIVWTLALPHVATLFADATPRTLLNRNVRGFLQGFWRAGAAAHYFGREWIALQKQPGALVGYDVEEDGVVLIEMLASWDGGIDVPADLAAPQEGVVGRYVGRSPIGLGEIFKKRAPLDVAEVVLRHVASAAAIEWRALEVGDPSVPVTRALDPIPEGLAIAPPMRVPIGWIDIAGAAGRTPWLGGDVLAPRWLMREIAKRAVISADITDLATAPINGARLDDLTLAAKTAIALV